MEIKQGDKVRVSKDAPELYTMYGQTDWESIESTVEKIDGDAAEIKHLNELSDEFDSIAIPIKYLVKVDAEAKEPKYHKDDKVCINKSSLKHGLRGEILTIIGVDVSDRTYYVQSRRMRSPIWLREDEISPYTKPTEQTEAEKTDADNLKKVAEEWANEVSNAIKEYGDAACKIIIDAHNEAYWDAYTADLAKDIVLKVASKYNDPEQAAEYAVSVAKAVVEGLKMK